MDSHLNSRSFGLIAVAVAWAVFLTIIGSPEVILFTVPVFMLAAPLALGRYLGEDLVVALGRFGRRSRSVSRPLVARPPVFASPVRGSLLIASNLAGRAPPAASA